MVAELSYESEQNALVKLSVSVKKKIGEGGVEIEKIRWIRYKGITIKNNSRHLLNLFYLVIGFLIPGHGLI